VDGPLADTYEAASGFFVQAAQAVPDTAWGSVGLGDWTVLDLVGHGNRAHTTVEEYLLRPQPPVGPGSDYFSEARINERAREAVLALGDDPKGTVASTAARVIALVCKTSANATLGSPARTMTLAEYLPSRIAELTIHGLDLTRALGTEIAVPAPVLQQSLRFLADPLVKQGKGELALLALSGRVELPPGFSAY
jgi:uncharacterized protein (TIGR03083 family)